MGWFASSPAVAPAPKPPQYVIDTRGWRTYNVETLNKEQCEVVKKACQEDASTQRFYTLALIGGSALGVAGIAYAAFLVAQVASPIILSLGATIAELSGLQLHPALAFTMQCLTHITTYTLAALGIKKLVERAMKEVSSHWAYAKHLDQQAIDARVQKDASSLV